MSRTDFVRPPRHDNIKFRLNPNKGSAIHEFKLGWGPCGRWVAGLRIEITADLVKIRQVSYSKDESKAFEFLKASFSHSSSMEKLERRAVTEDLKDDCEVKHFVYQMSDIASRITYTEI